LGKLNVTDAMVKNRGEEPEKKRPGRGIKTLKGI